MAWGVTEAKVGAVTVVSRSLNQARFGRRDGTRKCVLDTSSPGALPGSQSPLSHCRVFTERRVLAGHCPACSPFLKKLSVYLGRWLGKPGVRAHGSLSAMQPGGWSQPHAPGQESLAPSGETLLVPFLPSEHTGRAWSMRRPYDPCRSGRPSDPPSWPGPSLPACGLETEANNAPPAPRPQHAFF